MCPFDPTAIPIPDVPTSKNLDDTSEAQDGNESDDSCSADSSMEYDLTEEAESGVKDLKNNEDVTTHCTPAQEQLFETRYENG